MNVLAITLRQMRHALYLAEKINDLKGYVEFPPHTSMKLGSGELSVPPEIALHLIKTEMAAMHEKLLAIGIAICDDAK